VHVGQPQAGGGRVETEIGPRRHRIRRIRQIITVVNKRHDLNRFEPVPTIAAFQQKIGRAIGQSSNYELVSRTTKLGGNGPIMANALAAVGLGVTYIGALGYPTIHPVFNELARRAEEIVSVADHAHTDALEFADGKVMLGKLTPLNDVNWDNLVARVGRDRLASLIERSALVGTLNWTMLPHLTQIWERLLDEVLPVVGPADFPAAASIDEGPGQYAASVADAGGRRIFFVDLADPEKRTPADIETALQLLRRFQERVDVVLGMNLKESNEVAAALGVRIVGDPEKSAELTATEIRRILKIHCAVIHPRGSASAATEKNVVTFAGPFVKQPKISTGAGDHFNAGFCLGRVLCMSLEESLCLGVATSGYYVRTGISPSANDLVQFVAELPPPQA
jgi:hypothetical protein